MDHLNDVTEASTSNNIDEFKEWRDEKKKYVEDFCEKFEETAIGEIPEVKNFLNDFPRCMVQLTRQMCNCDQDCLSESFYNDHFDTTCTNTDFNNLFISRKYLPCGDFKIRISEGKMYKNDEFYSTPVIGTRINEALSKLCNNDQEYYDKLQCAAYELKDECEANPDCFKLFLQPSTRTRCKNPDFIQQVKEIEESSGLDEINLKLVDTDGYKSVVTKFGRNLRYTENISDEPIAYYDQKENVPPQIMIESTSHDRNVTTYGFIMGLTFFSILGYLTYKIYKKVTSNKKINNNLENDSDINII